MARSDMTLGRSAEHRRRTRVFSAINAERIPFPLGLNTPEVQKRRARLIAQRKRRWQQRQTKQAVLRATQVRKKHKKMIGPGRFAV